MDVAGGNDGFPQLLAQADNGTVEVPQLFLILGQTLVQHKPVIAQGLNLQKVIERRQTQQFLPAFALQNGLEQFARLTGRTDNQALPPPQQLRLGHSGAAFEVFQIGIGHQTVEVP